MPQVYMDQLQTPSMVSSELSKVDCGPEATDRPRAAVSNSPGSETDALEQGRIQTVPRPRSMDEPSSSLIKDICIQSSGFTVNKADTTWKYDPAFKRVLAGYAKKLGGRVEAAERVQGSVTHLVIPPNIRTPKSLSAGLMGKIVVPPEWLEQSFKHGYFLQEKLFGALPTQTPFRGKTVYITEGFKKYWIEGGDDKEAGVNKQIVQLAKALIVRSGSATLWEKNKSCTSVDFSLVSDAELQSGVSSCEDGPHDLRELLTWQNFLNRIPGQIKTNDKGIGADGPACGATSTGLNRQGDSVINESMPNRRVLKETRPNETGQQLPPLKRCKLGEDNFKENIHTM